VPPRWLRHWTPISFRYEQLRRCGKYFLFQAATLNFHVKEALAKVGTRTIEKFTPEEMGIAIDILSLGSTEPNIPKGINYPHLQHTYIHNL